MTKTHTFSALDGFRGLVAMTVCLHHTQAYWGISVPRSAIAVDLFFLLGGFVVAFSYEKRLQDGRMSFGDFVLVRMIRLYPLYFVSLLLAALPILAALYIHHNRPDYIVTQYVSAALLNVVVLPMHLTDSVSLYPLNVVYWSLFWALATNFAYAALIHRLTDRVLLTVAVAAGAALTAFTFVNHGINMGPMWGSLSLIGGMARAVFGMAAGVLLFRKHRAVPTRLLAGGGYLLPLALIALMLWSPAIGQLDWVLQLLAVFVVFPWCIARAARGPQPAGDRVLQTVGFISYPIYVLHVPLAHIMEMVTAKKMAQFAPLSGMVMVAILIGVAILADRRLDRPLRSWLTAKAFGPRHGASPATVTGVLKGPSVA